MVNRFLTVFQLQHIKPGKDNSVKFKNMRAAHSKIQYIKAQQGWFYIQNKSQNTQSSKPHDLIATYEEK